MSNDTKEYEIDKIIFHQTVNNKTLYLVKWKDCGLNQSTWEPEEHLINCPDILNDYQNKHNLSKNKK